MSTTTGIPGLYYRVGWRAEMEMKSLGDEVAWGIGWRRLLREGMMAKKNRLTRVAVGIGQAIGRADRKAHQVAKAGVMAKKELEAIGKQVDALKNQLQKTTRRLKKALR